MTDPQQNQYQISISQAKVSPVSRFLLELRDECWWAAYAQPKGRLKLIVSSLRGPEGQLDHLNAQTFHWRRAKSDPPIQIFLTRRLGDSLNTRQSGLPHPPD